MNQPARKKFWHRVAVLDDEGEAQQMRDGLLRHCADRFGGAADLGVAKESRMTREDKPSETPSLILGRTPPAESQWLVTAWYGDYAR